MIDGRLATTFKELTKDDTAEGFEPFRWQKRLLHRFVSGDLPTAVDVPTGLGKTSVVTLWLIALAEGADLPRRLVYVVDRRAVVDQATRVAERLRCNMPAELANKLRLDKSAGGLPISTLRGGFADNRDWLEDPSKPAIIVGTIDMVGSRLLFEGYGVSRRMRPYHAGLLGVDSLVVLDEAHLCPPFEALLRRIADHRDGEFGSRTSSCCATPPFHLMSLSATGRDMPDTPESIFRLQDEDRSEPVVHQRLTARKRLEVIELSDPKSLPEHMAKRAVELGTKNSPSRLLVYCNSRRDAVDVKNRIDKECKQRRAVGELATEHNSELLVGERRVHERKGLENWLEQQGFLGGAKTPPTAPTFLVATSAGEVGVDLDADHIVCDLVAYERMVQRLGRVNRRGGDNRTAMVDVFALRPEVKESARKVEKERSEKILDDLEKRLAPLLLLPCGEDERLDASPSATVELKSTHPEAVNAATTPAPLHPDLNRPLLDAWAMTSLEQHEGRPEVGPWLRGWEEDERPQTSVVWRQHLPRLRTGSQTSVTGGMVAGFFRTAPIHSTEKLEAESTHVLDWLLARADRLGKIEGDALANDDIVVIVLDRDGELVESANLGSLKQLISPASGMTKTARRERDRRKNEWKRLLPGRLLVVDKRMCGCRDGLLDEKSDQDVPSADADEDWRSTTDDSFSEKPRPLIRFQVKQVAAEDEEGLNLPEEVADWQLVRTFETRIDDGGVARQGLAIYKWHGDAEDEDSRSITSRPQLLRDHAKQVADRVRRICKALKLPNEEADALTIAARMHDDGKAAARWQRAMNAPDDGCVYAKTKGGGNLRLLEGYRHEFGSLIIAEAENLPKATRDLILHLIAAHHGNARPLVSCDGCEAGPPSALESKAGDAALRFVRLQQDYGPWGLAWREAILRAADQAASREWSEGSGRSDDG